MIFHKLWRSFVLLILSGPFFFLMIGYSIGLRLKWASTIAFLIYFIICFYGSYLDERKIKNKVEGGILHGIIVFEFCFSLIFFMSAPYLAKIIGWNSLAHEYKKLSAWMGIIFLMTGSWVAGMIRSFFAIKSIEGLKSKIIILQMVYMFVVVFLYCLKIDFLGGFHGD